MSCAEFDLIIPAWPAPARVRALVSTRCGGASSAPWASLNLGDHVGDEPAAVAINRGLLARILPAPPRWLNQVHGTRCIDAATAVDGCVADAAFTRHPGIVCAVLTADCLPVFLCDAAGSVVGIAHAGWRGLAAGVIESLVAAMAAPADQLLAWLGPAIGPQAFEVGDEVRIAFTRLNSGAEDAFLARGDGKWSCDLYTLARQRLESLGVSRIASADICTWRDQDRFYSYRRDGVTGRMASLIWLD